MQYRFQFSIERETDESYHLLTAGHCLKPDSSVSPADSVLQPASSSDYVGYESYNAPIYGPSWELYYKADAATAQYDGTSWSFGKVAWPDLGDTDFDSTVDVVTAVDAEAGWQINKVGWKTGRSQGNASRTCTYINWDPYSASAVDLDCAGWAGVDAEGGDSGGSVVVKDIQYPWVAAVGIVTGGDTASLGFYQMVYTHWSKINAELPGDWCVDIDCAPDPHVSIVSGPSEIPAPPPDIECTWSAAATGGMPPYSFAWSGAASGSGSALTTDDVTQTGWLYVTVTDYVGHEDVASMLITVDEEVELPEECEEWWQ